MTTPVFVVHGIGNRSKTEFEATVSDFAGRAGVTGAHPVYWGDLGADYRFVNATVPGLSADDIRGDDQSGAELLLGPPPADSSPIRNGETAVPEAVWDGVGEALDGGPEETRDEFTVGPVTTAEVREAIADEWAGLSWLPRITDEELLRAVGEAVARPVADGGVAQGDSGEEVRGVISDVRGFVRNRLQDLDRVVGAAFGAIGGRMNSQLRGKLLPGITQGVGDIIVYQRHRDAIGARVRKVINDVSPALGRDPDHPVDILAHSLGGVIAVDMATSDDPLWVRRLVTFGSQSPFFHVCDPRGGLLDKYAGAGAVKLPPSIGAWTNLWEPLDPVAFIAAKVFVLDDGSSPSEQMVPHLASSGLWTHTDYWALDSVATAIKTALA